MTASDLDVLDSRSDELGFRSEGLNGYLDPFALPQTDRRSQEDQQNALTEGAATLSSAFACAPKEWSVYSLES